MNMETDEVITEYCEAEEFHDSLEYGQVAGEIYELGAEVSDATPTVAQKAKRKTLSGLLRRMGYLVAAALSVVVISQSSTGEFTSVSPTSTVRTKMYDFSASGYDRLGKAHGGVIMVAKNGLWGAVDYNFKELVPCQYRSCAALTEKGYSAFYDLNDSYYIYDNKGRLVESYLSHAVYDHSVSGEFYGKFYTEGDNYIKEYFNGNGKSVSKEAVDFKLWDFYAFYDGKMLVNRTRNGATEYGVMDESGRITWQNHTDSDNASSAVDASKPKKKNFLQKLWHFILYFEFEEDSVEEEYYNPGNSGSSGGTYYDDNGCYEDFGDGSSNSNVLTFNSEQELMEYMGVDPTIFDFDEFITQQMGEQDYGFGGDDDFCGEDYSFEEDYFNPNEYASGGYVNGSAEYIASNSFQHGYATAYLYDTNDLYNIQLRDALMDEDYNIVYRFNVSRCYPDENKGFVVLPDSQITEGVGIKSYSYNGGLFSNYGTKMVWHIGNKDVLVDLSKQPGMTENSMSNRIVQSVHDEIYFSNENYWLFKDTAVYDADGALKTVGFVGFINHDGKVMKGYDNATEFAKGQALVVEGGKTYMIDEKFRKIKSYGETEAIGCSGDLLYIYQNGHQYLVNL